MRVVAAILVLFLACAGDSASRAAEANDSHKASYFAPDWPFLEHAYVPPPEATVGEMFPGVPIPAELSRKRVNLRYRPVARFKLWADQPRPGFPRSLLVIFLPCLLVVSFTGFVVCYLAEQRMGRAVSSMRHHFWRSLFSGAVVLAGAIIFARGMLVTGIGIPLGYLVLAILELGLLAGLAAVSWLIGGALLGVVPGKKWLSGKQSHRQAIEIVCGAAFVSLVVLIPGIGALPAIGIRVAVLLAIVGLGALVRTGRASNLMPDGR